MGLFNFFKPKPTTMALPYGEYSLEELVKKANALSKAYDETDVKADQLRKTWHEFHIFGQEIKIREKAEAFGKKNNLSKLEILEKEEELLNKNKCEEKKVWDELSLRKDDLNKIQQEWTSVRKAIKFRKAEHSAFSNRPEQPRETYAK